LSMSPDLFQANMQMLLADLPFVKVYLDDVLIFSNGSYQDHMKMTQIPVMCASVGSADIHTT